MQLKSRLNLITISVAVAAASVGVAIAASGVPHALSSLHGTRLAVFLVGLFTIGVAVYFFQRGLRRRARLDAISDLLPSYRHHRQRYDYLSAQGELDGEPSGGIPIARAEIRAATRALLVSLEDEMRRESGHTRRYGRPACRRARFRTVGRAEPRRRRVVARLASTPS